MRAALLAAAILVAAFAGCVSSEPDEPAPARGPTYGTGLEGSLSASLAPASGIDDWYLISLATDDDGGAAGFRWTIPEGAIEDDELRLEIAPFVPAGGETVREWELLIFEADGDQANLVGRVLAPTLAGQTWLAVLETPSTIPPPTAPSLVSLWLGWTEIEEGDDLYLVLTAATDGPAEFGLGFLPTEADEPSGSVEEFLEDREGRAPVVPPRLGSAPSHQLSIYLEYIALAALGFEYGTDSITVEDRFPVDPRPVATLRDVAVNTSFAAPSGWTYGFGAYLGYNGLGTWNVDIRARNAAAAGHSVYAHSFTTAAVIGTILLLGFPLWAAVGEGEGEDSLRFELQIANAPDYVELFEALQISLGTPLRDVIGLETMTEEYVLLGLLGDVPPQASARFTADGLVVSPTSTAQHLLLGIEAPSTP